MKTERDGTRRGENLSAVLVCNVSGKHIYDWSMLGEVFRDFGIIEIMETGEEKTFLQRASLDCTLMIALVLEEMIRDNR